MKKVNDSVRRSLIKGGLAALTLAPLSVFAAKNDKMRAQTKYKDTPEGDKECSNCALFIPGKAPDEFGGCKIYAGDTEVAPKGYCIAWAKKP